MSGPAKVWTRRRDRQREETRERLFQAAVDEFRRVGAANAQIDRIATAVGVARGTFYFHFPTKDDVLLEWEHRREAEVVARLEGARGAGRSIREVLLEVARFLVRLETSEEDRRLLRDTFSMHLRQPADRQRYPLFRELKQQLARAAERGDIRNDVAAEVIAVLFTSSLVRFLVAHSDPHGPAPKPELLIDVFLNGVGARARAPRTSKTMRSRR